MLKDMKKYVLMKIVIITILFSMVMACSNGGTGTSEPLVLREGRFLDSAVAGLQYSSGDHTGITDINGTFQYEEGKRIKFFLGNIVLGETAGKPIITPIDLDPNGSVSHPKIINICRFLLTLDVDADPNNGINIPMGTSATISGSPLVFDVSEQSFENLIIDTLVNGNVLVSSDLAQNHLQKTLDKIAQEALDSAITGTWVGAPNNSCQVSKAFLTFESKGSFCFNDEKEGLPCNLTGMYTIDKDIMPYRLTLAFDEGTLWTGENQGNTVSGFYLIDHNRLTITWIQGGNAGEGNPLHYSTWIHQSELVSFPDYFPSDPEKYGLKTFQRTYGGSSSTHTSRITGQTTVPYLSGVVPGVTISGLMDTNRMTVYRDEEKVIFLGFDDELLAEGCSLTCPASGWTLSTVFDGMIIDQGTYYWVNTVDATCCEETGSKLLIDIQNVRIPQGDYAQAVIVWHLDKDAPFTELDFQGNDAELGITLPAGSDTGDCSITAFEMYGRDTGPIASGAIDPLTGSLISIHELSSIHSLTWVLLDRDKTSHPLLVTDRTLPDVEDDEINALTASNNIFAFKLYQKLEDSGVNLVFSPYAFSRAMAMTLSGSAGETDHQIQVALNFEDQTANLHPVFNALDLNLNERESPVLQTETSAWGQTGYFMHINFYNLLAANYCKAIQSLDFKSATQDSQASIEKWITDYTGGLLSQPTNSITDRVRWAGAATVNLTGTWAQPFDSNATSDGTFELDSSSNQIITVPMMTQTANFPFTEDEQYQAIELAFRDSNLAMLLLIPASGHYQEFEASLSYEKIQHILEQLDYRRITLHLPLFSFTCGQDLQSELSSLGISDAKSESQADFSGINELDDLYLNGSKYMTHISVKESGVRSAGSTTITLEGKEDIPIPEWFGNGLIMAANTSYTGVFVMVKWNPFQIPQPIEVALSRPFIFVIRDASSGAILFLGRLMDPRD